jgi:mannose-6-phosphate isomerase-like protein (cupin superfamily)
MSDPHHEPDLEALRQKRQQAMEQAQAVSVVGRPELTVRDEANALIANCLRNNELFEGLHAGTWSPLLEDASLSRITDDEMKKLMIEVSARLAYMLVLKATDPDAYAAQIDWNRRSYTSRWERLAVTVDLPERGKVGGRHCASCDASLYDPRWKFCPLCGASTTGSARLPAFPAFMKNAANRIATSSQHTPGVDGFVFDGANGGQMAFWSVERDAVTAEHVHEFDEWFLVVEGSYTVTLNGDEVRVGAGQEYFIPKGTKIAGRVKAGTRTIHAFGGRRAERDVKS